MQVLEEFCVIRVTVNGLVEYLNEFDEPNDYDAGYELCEELEYALQIPMNDEDHLMRTILGLRKVVEEEYPDSPVQIEPIRIEYKAYPLDLNSEDWTQRRQNYAINKLTTEDIEVLGLEKIATYLKLKFHNSEEASGN